MLVIVGSVVVVVAILSGYLWEGGKLLLLVQPAELLIIGGSAPRFRIVPRTSFSVSSPDSSP